MRPLFAHLYLRIWLAVLLAIVVLTLLIAAAWKMSRDDESHEFENRSLIVRNAEGDILFAAPVQPKMGIDHGLVFAIPLDTSMIMENTIYMQLPPRPPPLYVVMSRWLGKGWFSPATFYFWFLAVAASLVALSAYPVVRRLTKRLEGLQNGVEKWGAGELDTRVPVQGHDEIASLARQFNDAASRIETLVNSHKTLLANASHELRSPLARIHMGIELAGKDLNPANKTEVTNSLAELDQLIDEILLASRLDAPQANVGSMENIDFTALVAEECARVGAELDAEHIEVQGVAKLLRRLVRNLLENAKRYGGTGGIEVALRRDPKTRETVLTVQDNGQGVAPAYRDKIFEPFFRKPGASEQDGGVGLGLALVQSIAKHHHAKVICTDRADGKQGACFMLSMKQGMNSPQEKISSKRK